MRPRRPAVQQPAPPADPPTPEEGELDVDPEPVVVPTGRHRPVAAEPETPSPPAVEARSTKRQRALTVTEAEGAVERATPSPAAARGARGDASQHVAVQVLDRIGDAVGVLCVTYLCTVGKISGTEALITISALLGVLQGIRRISPRGAAGGGLLVMALGLTASALAGATSSASVLGPFASGGGSP